MKIETALFALVMVGAFFILLSANLGSLKAMTVLGGSMSPALNVGDMIFIGKVAPDAISKGDIITYSKEDAIVTHRVVEIVKSGFIVQGDANEDPDAETVKPAQLVGKVQFSVPVLGAVMNFVRSKTGLLVFIIFPGLVMMGTEVRRVIKYRKSGAEEKVSKSSIFMLLIVAGLLTLNLLGTGAYFSDVESSAGNFIALGQGACLSVEVNKWWTDSNFLPFWDMNYNGSFDVVTHYNNPHEGSYKISGTNPGSFFVHINITGLPEIKAGDEFRIEDELLTSLDEYDDFGYQSQSPVRIYMMGEDCGWGGCEWEEITDKFDYDLQQRDPWIFTLKDGESIPKTHAVYVTIHLQYILQQLTEQQIALFPFDYDNVARVYVKNKIFESYYATITGNLKEVSGWVAGASAGTAPYFPTPEDIVPEEPLEELLAMELNDTGDNTTLENVTIDGNETESLENITVETNTTIEMNDTEDNSTEVNVTEDTTIYHFEEGVNVFEVPDGWNTTAMQLTIDYPLMLEIAYIELDNVFVYIAGAPENESFGIVPAMVLNITASEPFNI